MKFGFRTELVNEIGLDSHLNIREHSQMFYICHNVCELSEHVLYVCIQLWESFISVSQWVGKVYDSFFEVETF